MIRKVLGIILIILPLAFAFICIDVLAGREVAIFIFIGLACIVSFFVGLWLLIFR
jgi:hypothetical protein